ncbi:hypothetical protein OAO01_00905 [Oligoflexia bacterium]|nr:hypothetical protein [Oligoflexia bacterium]
MRRSTKQPILGTSLPTTLPAVGSSLEKTALILDDREETLNALQTTLSKQGYCVHAAASVSAAKQAVLTRQTIGGYDLIVSDFSLGRKLYQKHKTFSGFRFVCWCRAIGVNAHIILHSTCFEPECKLALWLLHHVFRVTQTAQQLRIVMQPKSALLYRLEAHDRRRLPSAIKFQPLVNNLFNSFKESFMPFFQYLNRRATFVSATCIVLALLVGSLYLPYVAIGEMGTFFRNLPGMPKVEALPSISETLALNSDTTPKVLALKKVKLPAPTGLGTFGGTVSSQLKIFGQGAEDHFLSLINSAPNLTEAQKKLIRKSVSKTHKKLWAAFGKIGKASAQVGVTLSEQQFIALSKDILKKQLAIPAKKKKKKRVKATYFALPLGGKVVANESKAVAVYQLNSYIGFLIHFLSNSNSGNSLINQLKAISNSSQAAYLEQLRTGLNSIFVATIGDLTKQTTQMLTKLYKGKTAKAKDFDFMNFVNDGDNSFTLAFNNISAGSSRAPTLSLNLDRTNSTVVVKLENVRGGPIEFKGVYDAAASPQTIAFSDASATFESAFATLASIVAGQFTLNANLSTDSTIQTNNIVLGTDITIVPGQASLNLAFEVSNKGLVSGTLDLNLPGLPEGIPMEVTFIGYVDNSMALHMMQLVALPSSLGTGGHSLSKHSF